MLIQYLFPKGNNMTPVKALYGHDPPTLLHLIDEPSLNEAVNIQIEDHNAILDELKTNLLKAQD